MAVVWTGFKKAIRTHSADTAAQLVDVQTRGVLPIAVSQNVTHAGRP